MEATIRKVENGWILSLDTGVTEDPKETWVYNYDEQSLGREQECESFICLLHRLISHLGPEYQKYEKHNISLEIKPGHKVDEEE